jgi:hypothetical protein
MVERLSKHLTYRDGIAFAVILIVIQLVYSAGFDHGHRTGVRDSVQSQQVMSDIHKHDK